MPVGIAALVVLAVAVVAAARHGAALADEAAANKAISVGAYDAAQADISKATAEWPWASMTSEQQQIAALKASNAALLRADFEASTGNYLSAISDLRRVIPQDRNYATASQMLTNFESAVQAAQLIDTFISDDGKYGTALQQFWDDYNASVTPLNNAWHSYTSNIYCYVSCDVTDQSALQQAQGPVSAVAADYSGLTSAASTIAVDLGSAKSNGLLNGYNVDGLLLSYEDASTQAGVMDNGDADELSTLQEANVSATQVENDISKDNAALDQLEKDQTKIVQGSAEFAGFAKEKIQNSLGPSANLQNLVPEIKQPEQSGG